ncbi:transcriptional regulator [Streptomyces europaeiscabiei]|uniref:transcriptional regulator n=1 Tax=Streptomyces europaeiscabiei TaxID=146819 RepID=UPI0029B28ACA|nr:transcriptional regulator [Streptomyces europaeiscabiei]MDX3637049.1 transcriptional regulator [Streptomyces europaeiscabiei]MDX3655193.1 transcriptional regulator [Streptomyces europaeiscabiei]
MSGSEVLQGIGALASVAGIAGGYYAWRALDDTNVKASQDRFRAVRTEFRENLSRIADMAADLHTAEVPQLERIGGSAVLTTPRMRPPVPLPIDRVRLLWEDAGIPEDRALQAAARKNLPRRTRWNKYSGYAETLDALMRPALFENRSAFRLLHADWQHPDGPVMSFGPGRYFDLVDQGEALFHELARAVGKGTTAPSLRRLPMRALLMSDPLSLPRRGAIPSIGTLTVRRTAPGHGTFFLIYRTSGQVATGEETYNVIPGGIFQPASFSPLGHRRDLDLWRNIMREFNEELLGAPEATGAGGSEVDYDAPPYVDFTRAMADSRLKVWNFGMGIEAHNLVPCLLTAAVFDADVFDTLFASMVERTSEGILISGPRGSTVTGLPLEAETVRDLLASPRLSPIPAALLHLVLQHRELLLGSST